MQSKRGRSEDSPTFRFGPFRLDQAKCALLRGVEPVPLPPKSLRCLVHLLNHRDRVVSRGELLDVVWGTEHLSPGVVPQAVLRLRQALGDTGETQLYIETVRGFGYRWTVEVQIEHRPKDALVRPPQKRNGFDPREVAATVAVLTPLVVPGQGEDRWVRLGVMDFINERLRSCGLSMVSSDTVISLLAGNETPDGADIDRLREWTGAQIVLSAQASKRHGHWTVSMQTIRGIEPMLTTAGEGYEVIEAARAAADLMAQALGLTPPEPMLDGPHAQPLRFSQQLLAALWSGGAINARTLLANAKACLLEHPEVKYHIGTVEVMDGHLDAARSIFEQLLHSDESTALRARSLHALSFLCAQRKDWAEAQRLEAQALNLIGESTDPPNWLGAAELNVAAMAVRRGEFPFAREHYARARWVFHRHSHLSGLALVDLGAGELEMLEGRPEYALRHHRNAEERFRALGKQEHELEARARRLEAHLSLLDLDGATRLSRGLEDLAADRPDALESASLAKEMLARLEQANGHPNNARALLAEALAMVADDLSEDWRVERAVSVLAMLADVELEEGNAASAAELAQRALRQAPDRDCPHMVYPARCRAWLALVRSHLRMGAIDRARAAAEELEESVRGGVPTHSIRARLAMAETAAASGCHEQSHTAYEQALNDAERGQAIHLVLDVAQSFVTWLFTQRALPEACTMRRAMDLVYRLSPFATQWYEAALLQLRTYHARGDHAAWRAALEQARVLAGERVLPPQLQSAPRPRGR